MSAGFVRSQNSDTSAATGQTAVGTPAAAETSTPAATPPVYTDPPQLFPEMPLPEAPQSEPGSRSRPAKRKSPAASEDIKDRIRFREVRTRALKDPDVQRQLALAEGAKTDAEKRDAYRNYYKALYARMTKIDPSLKVRARQKEDEALAQLAQIHIEPAPKTVQARTSQLPPVAEQIKMAR